ncbi:ABC-2 type transport system ATP-binding protein [Hydrogenispora ethanolica]|uniref:ABC-2 type transport system ATP-binding protein n=1 Tax=Hydrogenispora ethanolica TaxID=1082276 RepID=A0A4R1RC15_HYDET|nr:ABC transporter ATP-binding protein [Hydrogenispora ethanolica]TCL63343.1 ABC-2 type transport system ATP-binding protein [Hydrogenispora ethanolica]
MNNLVSVVGLSKKIAKKQVLLGVSFQLEAGRVVGLLGPNGSGKTTLLKTLMHIYQADAGEIAIADEPLSFASKRFISYMPDHNALFEWMSVQDAIHYYRDLFSDFDSERASELCSFLEIDPQEKLGRLSKGMKERVLIMLTFSRKARLYLLDEPLGGIDPLTRNKIIKTILTGLTEECTIIIATHLVKDVEAFLDEVLFLHHGKLIFSGSADNIRSEHGKSIEEWYLEVYQNA